MSQISADKLNQNKPKMQVLQDEPVPVTIDKKVENEQRKITEYFIKNIRKEIEDSNEEAILNTQDFINDARERRALRHCRSKTSQLELKTCKFELD